MTDFEKLESIMKRTGATVTAIANAAGFSRETYHNRKKGIGEFTAREIQNITETLRLTPKERDEIFFAQKCDSDARETL